MPDSFKEREEPRFFPNDATTASKMTGDFAELTLCCFVPGYALFACLVRSQVEKRKEEHIGL